MRKNNNSQYDPALIVKEVHDYEGQSIRISNSRSVADQFFTHFRATYSGDQPTEVLYYLGTAPHISLVGTVADVAGSLTGKYFTITSAPDQVQYYVWFKVSGAGTDPTIEGATGIVVDINTDDSAQIVALAIQLTINNLHGSKFQCSRTQAVVEIRTVQYGEAANSTAGTSGFTITNTAGAQKVTNSIKISYFQNDPVYQGQRLKGMEYNIYSGEFETRDQSPRSRSTSFGEILTGTRTAIINLRPTWGISDVRDLCYINGAVTTRASLTANDISEIGGEIRVKSGITANESRFYRTVERGQYQPGAECEVGIGARIPTNPTGTTDLQWGYYDIDNGFGYGVDSTGNYVFVKDAGVIKKTYQKDWNRDQVDGTGGRSNPSGLERDLADGNVFNIIFTWYGYGAIRYFINLVDPSTGLKRLTEVHRITISNRVTIVDPNQPISATIENGTTPGADVSLYVGGRQFAIVGVSVERDRRLFNESIVNYTLPSASGIWHPLICLRRKGTHGPSGRRNSVATLLKSMTVQTDNLAEFKIMYRDVTTGGVYAAPTGVPAGESACETKIQDGTVAGNDTGIRVLYDFLNNGRNSIAREATQEQVFIASEFEMVLYVRRLTTTGTTVSAAMEWEEDW